MRKIILLIILLLPTHLLSAQVIRSEHANPQAGNQYNSSTTAGCAPCSITNPAFAADSSLTNYAVVAAAGSASARAKVKVKLTDTATSGAQAGIAMKRSGSANPAVLSKITINTYLSGTLQESKTGSNLSTFVLNATSGLRAIEFTSTKKFDEVEVEVHRLGSGINSIDLYYGYGEDPAPLPVELVSFNAFIENSIVRLKWQTASEYNNDYFIVEKSTDGINFSYLDKVDAVGYSSDLTQYSSVDFHPEEVMYYRLKQVDLDESITISKVVKVCMPDEALPLVSAYPNPASNQLTISTQFLPSNSTLYIKGLDGGTILSQTLSDDQNVTLNIEEIPVGIYLVVIVSADGEVIYEEKLVKL